jgi:hypothetical protein
MYLRRLFCRVDLDRIVSIVDIPTGFLAGRFLKWIDHAAGRRLILFSPFGNQGR